jgi:hypothetical protein
MVRAIERVLGSRVERRHVEGFDYGGSFAQPKPAREYANARPQPGRGANQETHKGAHTPVTAEPAAADAKPTRSRRRRPYWRRQGTQA